MPKKKAAESEKSAEITSNDARVHILKLRLSPSEMQSLRVAAAVENLQPGVFAREIVLEAAERVVDDFRDA